LTDQGTVLDDTIIFQLEENDYLAVVNAGMGSRVAQHLTIYRGNRTVLIMDLTDSIGKIDLQGPMSGKIRTGAVLPLSHQDIGAWPFINHPWHFALPFNAAETRFTKEFIGDMSLLTMTQPEYTYPVVGDTVCKVCAADQSVVLDSDENDIGSVLTCVTDMGIGWHQDKIYSIASPGKPTDFNPHGLCCGFVKVKKTLKPGQTLFLQDRRRTIRVRAVKDIRPDRTARRPINEMI